MPWSALVKQAVAQIDKSFLLPRAGRRFVRNEVLAAGFF
jgi:hypothetical protein